MEAIRSIQTVADGEVYLQLPEKFWGKEVEIIVLPSVKQAAQKTGRKKSLRGSLSHYANSALIEQEQEAWLSSASDKHVSR